MRLFVVFLCFGAADAAAAAKSLDNESIREAVKLWLSDRAAAEAILCLQKNVRQLRLRRQRRLALRRWR